MEPDVISARLRALDTPTLSDALDALGLPAGLGRFVPFGPAIRVAGRARTVELADDDGVPRDRHLCTTAIESSEPGDVIVVAHGGTPRGAGWGGLLSAAAQEVGVAGVVVSGACRDVDDYVAIDFPVFARHSVPASARTRVVEVATGVPVQLDDVRVAPMDWVVADRSGVVVIPAAEIDRVLATAARVSERERLMVADLRSGSRVTEVLGRQYETMLQEVTND
ncbi:MAG: RraA family protein [Acidimicrobiia bacterium]